MSLLSFAKKAAGRQAATQPPAAVKKKTTAPAKEAKRPVEQAAVAAIPAGSIELTPLVTEKSVGMHADTSTVAFRVRAGVTKPQIAAAVQARYNVMPARVRTVAMRGKVRRRGQTAGATADWKKAYVTLPEGASLDFSV